MTPQHPPAEVSERKWSLLFVDDEEQILSGLRNVFRRQRKRWSMRFVSDPHEAAQLLERERFDLVISDMRMPGLDGAQLLAKARQLQPEAIRFVLSGHGDLDSSLRAAQVAHQYFTKPCRPENLRSAIEGVLSLRDALDDSRAWRTVGKLYQLPVSLEVFSKVEEALAAGAEATDVASLIEGDSGLTAKVLQTVNSSFFRLRREVTRVEEAVVYLGMGLVRSLVLATEVFNAPECGGVDTRVYAAEGLKVGAVAQGLLPAGQRKARDEAFTAGLLHDVGSLVIAACCPEEQLEINARVAQGVRLSKAEHDVLGEDHASIGAYQLGLWGLPPKVVEAVALHHTPVALPKREDLDATSALQLAHLLLETLEGPGLHGSYDLERVAGSEHCEEDSALLRCARAILAELPPVGGA